MKKIIFYLLAIFIIATACEKNEQAKKTDKTDKKSTEAVIDTTGTTPNETPVAEVVDTTVTTPDETPVAEVVDTTGTTPDETPTYNYITLKELPSYDCADEKSIIGTWKCVGFGNSETNKIRLITEPQNCKKCYTVTFNADGTIVGYTVNNEIFGKYSLDSKITKFNYLKVEGTKVNEFFDGEMYGYALQTVRYYTFYSKCYLQLYYNDKKEYLILKTT